MQNNLASEASKPPPLPASIADHARPASAPQPAPPPQWINLNLIVPDLSIRQWMWRLFKFGLALAVVYIGLLIPLVLIKALEKYLEFPGRPF
ncbi:hypothetical protein [Haliangium sp. UPWRP_2]|uniref:hypothetical protein n=1 Tax=Haliangium sp. UPWRP_2 TaxID=1931276 RepID=UPI000B545C1B|nr:hypothetical protein [Haliangium sp. UPWRP_2]PSM31677.1 hypothetical protein BVG81_004215 [Haliangium sp. UPWRP_2]